MSGSVITGQALKNLTAGEHWIAGTDRGGEKP